MPIASALAILLSLGMIGLMPLMCFFNVEIIAAKEKNIPIIERADFLGELTRCY